MGDQADWEHRYGGDRPMWSGNPNGTLVHEVADLQPGRVLDVGAGEGGDAMWFAERGWQVTATDISANALARVTAEAGRRGLDVECRQLDGNALDAFAPGGYDLVSMQYGSIHRTPDQRALANLLAAVAPGGTLLVVGHDLTPLQQPVDVATQTRMFDPGAYLGIDEIAAALADSPEWKIELHETRPRPAGALSTHHVDDVVLRARRLPV
ncbi:MAG: class I SAM-dependent methyltransferase [Ilumatobacteraceae bacterium]